MTPDFFEKLHGCKHLNRDPDYCEPFSCSTPYCSGWEDHCLDCGAYISVCGCGSENGISDKPYWKDYKERWQRDDN